MYIKGKSGPVEIELPDGKKLNMSDLPPKTTSRWVASRKLVIVNAVTFGLISQEQACDDYALSPEELQSWIDHAQNHGPNSLKVTRLAKYRQL